jgi:hypothetical protein
MKIKDGHIYAYYSFDVAAELQLDKLEKVFGKKPVESQLAFTRLTPKYVQYAQPPYLIKLGEKQVELSPGNKYSFNVTAKLYDFGVVSIRLSMKFSGEMDDLIKLSELLVENKEAEKEVTKQMDRIKKEIADVLVKPVETSTFEDYIIFYVKEFEKRVPVKDLVEKSAHKIASILRSETEELNEEQVKDTLKTSVSYFTDDVVFVDWNAAFIYDPRDAVDTLEVLEYANIELLELRTYDTMLDKEIDKAYDRMALAKSKPWYLIGVEPFSPTLDRLEEVRLDITQVMEKVENALKLVGDPYLAKVYRAASESFRLSEWKAGLKEKLDIMEDFYDTLVNRIQTSRFLVLDTTIVLLIVLEIALLFLPGAK